MMNLFSEEDATRCRHESWPRWRVSLVNIFRQTRLCYDSEQYDCIHTEKHAEGTSSLLNMFWSQHEEHKVLKCLRFERFVYVMKEMVFLQ